MSNGSKLKITLNEDGTVKLNAQGMIGEEAELLDELKDLAKEVGGDLEVEKHIEGAHHHHHHDHKHKHRN